MIDIFFSTANSNLESAKKAQVLENVKILIEGTLCAQHLLQFNTDTFETDLNFQVNALTVESRNSNLRRVFICSVLIKTCMKPK